MGDPISIFPLFVRDQAYPPSSGGVVSVEVGTIGVSDLDVLVSSAGAVAVTVEV